jgi:tripartite-type tricarboxylate transporter receptor subunit TctC
MDLVAGANMRTLVTVALCAAVVASPAARADADTGRFPSHAIRIVVPNPVGGSIDLVARALADRLGPLLGQPVVIDNRPGASGLIGARAVLVAPPDGYCLLASSSSTNTIMPHVQADAGFDGVRDFAPIANVAWTTKSVVVNPSLPVATLRELIAYAKAHPRELNYVSTGPGSSPQLDTGILMNAAGIEMTEVPYKSVTQQITSLIANEVQVGVSSLTQTVAAVRAGNLRALAVVAPKRSPLLPDVPTLAEAGLPGVDFRVWIGLSAPASTPPAVIAMLNRAVNRALADPAFIAWMQGQGIEPIGGSPEAFLATLLDDDAKWSREIARLHITR